MRVCSRWLSVIATIFLLTGSSSLRASAPEGFRLDPRCEVIPWPATEVAPGQPGQLLTVTPEGLSESRDGGKTWSKATPIVTGEPPVEVAQRYSFLQRTKNGVLVIVHIDPSTAKWVWDEKQKTATTARRDVWSIRSLDGGKTWTDRTLVCEGYSGYLERRQLSTLPSGRLVIPVQHWIPQENRHAQLVFASDDQGKTWQKSSLVDVGGRGHHDGAMESTMERLQDGRLWLLMRTNLDAFWQSFSKDGGATWSDPQATAIDASSSPGAMKRLSDGRLILVWNRLYPEGKTEVKRKPMDGIYASSNAASSQREELSIAFFFR